MPLSSDNCELSLKAQNFLDETNFVVTTALLHVEEKELGLTRRPSFLLNVTRYHHSPSQLPKAVYSLASGAKIGEIFQTAIFIERSTLL